MPVRKRAICEMSRGKKGILRRQSAWAKRWLEADGTPNVAALAALPAEARDALSALWVEAADGFYVPV